MSPPLHTAVQSNSALAATTVTGLSIGEYLIRRLQDYGIRDVFGIPGDYILSFYHMLDNSPINVVGCTREDCAGFAADAYARVNGLGAVCVTYTVGGLSLCNSIAGAYAEKSPVVVIAGSPGMRERINNPLLHHKVKDFRTQAEVFEKICTAGTELTEPSTAFREIDRVLDAAARTKRPVYIELPRDMVDVVPDVPYPFRPTEPVSDPDSLAEAVAEAVEWINRCQRAVIVAGVEIHRFGLQDDFVALAEGSQIPFAATLLGKSVISELHPLYVGLYEGAMGRAEVTQFVEESDCVILLGTFMTDLNLGIFTANLNPANCIYATSEQLRIRHHHFQNVQLADFILRFGGSPAVAAAAESPAEAQALQRELSDPPGGADHDRPPDRPAQRITDRRHGDHRRRGGFAVRGNRAVRSHPDDLHLARVLHVDGLCGARGPGRARRPRAAAGDRDRRRRGVSDDVQRTFDDRPPRISHDRHRARQPRLRNRAGAASRELQRHQPLAIPQAAGDLQRGHGLRSSHGKRIRRSPPPRPGRHDQHEPHPSPHRPRRPQQRPAPPGRPPQQAGIGWSCAGRRQAFM